MHQLLRCTTIFVFALIAAYGFPSQEAFDDGDSADVATPESALLPATTAQPAYVPISLGENFRYGYDRVFSPGKLFLFSLKAAVDQQRGAPEKWGQGVEGYSDRLASHFGRALIRENIAFGVRALDGEDPRYEYSRDTGVWKRSKHAVARTFVVRGRNGQLMPAYSRFVADYAAPMISEQWAPDRFSPARALRTGTTGIGLAVATNLGTEFWPDLRRKFLRR